MMNEGFLPYMGVTVAAIFGHVTQMQLTSFCDVPPTERGST